MKLMLKACKECKHREVCWFKGDYLIIAKDMAEFTANRINKKFSCELRCVNYLPENGHETRSWDYFSIDGLLGKQGG
jgi:hypothetical protein